MVTPVINLGGGVLFSSKVLVLTVLHSPHPLGYKQAWCTCQSSMSLCRLSWPDHGTRRIKTAGRHRFGSTKRIDILSHSVNKYRIKNKLEIREIRLPRKYGQVRRRIFWPAGRWSWYCFCQCVYVIQALTTRLHHVRPILIWHLLMLHSKCSGIRILCVRCTIVHKYSVYIQNSVCASYAVHSVICRLCALSVPRRLMYEF